MELSKRWRWLGVEFVVIALGVFSALVVDTWVEDRKNTEREAVYLQRLAADLANPSFLLPLSTQPAPPFLPPSGP